MITFSDWKESDGENDGSLNESANLQDALRAKLSSSSPALLQALGGNTPPPVQEIQKEEEDLSKTLANLIEKTQREIESIKKEEEVQVEEGVAPVEEEDPDLYKLYRDKEETFECNISVQGASLASSQVRLIIDTSIINLVYYGKLYKDGRCLVQIGKMTHFPEGTRGRIRLEVIVDDTVFAPWESACIVEGAKRVTVEVKGKKSVTVNLGETK